MLSELESIVVDGFDTRLVPRSFSCGMSGCVTCVFVNILSDGVYTMHTCVATYMEEYDMEVLQCVVLCCTLLSVESCVVL